MSQQAGEQLIQRHEIAVAVLTARRGIGISKRPSTLTPWTNIPFPSARTVAEFGWAVPTGALENTLGRLSQVIGKEPERVSHHHTHYGQRDGQRKTVKSVVESNPGRRIEGPGYPQRFQRRQHADRLPHAGLEPRSCLPAN